MKIVELILDEEQEDSGIDAISIVESPAIESDFVALNNQEIKLAELDKEKKILLGALLIPNKPIFRNGDEGDYYIFFSKETIVKASQMYLKNGYQNNSTLEHKDTLKGLTLVESWIVEDKVNDKSRKYGLDVPVGTWMGAVKVNNDEIWNEYVKSGKVKGFSIEGYFADKMERPKESIKEDMSEEKLAEQLLGKIESIVKGEKVELKNISVINQKISNLKTVESKADKAVTRFEKAISVASKEFDVLLKFRNEIYNETYREAPAEINDFKKSAKELGLNPDSISEIKELEKILNTSREVIKLIDSYKRPQY
tara:strand:- start:1024 stop:1956 length:933 start_codon:yes stop_codon:yes gene_type:complete